MILVLRTLSWYFCTCFCGEYRWSMTADGRYLCMQVALAGDGLTELFIVCSQLTDLYVVLRHRLRQRRRVHLLQHTSMPHTADYSLVLQHTSCQTHTTTDGQTDGQKDRQRLTDGQTSRQMDRRTDRRTHRQTDRQMDRRTDRQTERQTETDGWTDKQTDGQTDRQTDTQTDRV